MSFVDPPLAEVGDWPPPTPANAADLIALASERIRAHCGWQITERVDDIIVLDYDGRGLISAPTLHLTDVAELAADGTPVDPSMFDWYDNGLIRLRWARWPSGPRRFALTCTHGYDPVPLAVSAAAVTVARELDSNPLGANSVRVGDVSVTYGQGSTSGLAVLTSVDGALAPYRINQGVGMIPTHTTTITILRRVVDDVDAYEEDLSDEFTYAPVVAGVRAHLDAGSGSSTFAGGERSDALVRWMADPCDVTTTDLILDETTGWRWQVTALMPRPQVEGILDHMSGLAQRWEGVAG